MFTKEAQELAKPCYEAIKKIAERKECPTCVGYGGTDLVKMPGLCATMGKCPTCKGTGKVKWEGELEPRDEFIATDGSSRFVVSTCSGGVRDDYGYHWSTKLITPLLEWQKIEEILEGMGYDLLIGKHERIYGASVFQGKKCLSIGDGKSRQPAVMRAVIELGKEK